MGERAEDRLQEVIAASLRRHVAAGVTTVRDLGDRRFAVSDWRVAAHADGPYPRVIAAGPPITSVGGHCANMGGEAAGGVQLRDAVRERVERGVDIVKVMASGGFATPGTEVMRCQFELDELRGLVEVAHAAGLPVTAHSHGRPAVLMAMAAGVDGIEHCSFLTDKGPAQTAADLDQLARTRTAVCPTLGFRGTPPAPPAGVALLAKLGLTFEQVAMMNKRRVAAMHAAGVRIVSGSDGGINAAKPHGLLPLSIAALVEGGIETVAALASATSLAATVCGLGDDTGRLRAGFAADVLVIEGNVVDDIAGLARPTATFTAGHKIDPTPSGFRWPGHANRSD
jgi:imidazolonepropionase-like amidohydrolase